MLNLTKKERSERNALRVNPCKTCQPVGAIYAALGVHNCMPHSHGSQGCVSYHRTFLTRHFKEPAIASTSSFTEGASVFGGGSNLRTGVKNIFDIYNPDIIAVHTTCLSETIGDDLNSYIQDMDIPEGKLVIHANTPSYVGSHIFGFYNMMTGFINYLSEATGNCNGKTAIFPGFVNPGDIREMKRLANYMKVPFTMFPDQSGVMDVPMTGDYTMYPKGGTRIPEIAGLGDCKMVLALGELTSEEPASLLERKCKVPYTLLPLPIGIEATDRFVMELAQLSNEEVPYELEEERGQLVDIMLDAHAYFYNKAVAIFGDPDTVLGLTRMVLEMGMLPKYVLTGTPGENFVKLAGKLFEQYGVEGCTAKAAGDLFELHQWIKNEKVDLMIGTSYGKSIARAEDIPFVRAGFPVLDRYAHPYFPIVGYKGALRLVERIAEALMDRQDKTCSDEDFEMVM
ncbi:nitrogenase molybdenum-iron protein beta chain [Ruminiclostridium sufflavum DSM 19573]|uniref:Nitrogenase molybdenum-iron protein beta chain n=1 Tax=Ruminiclostridium sufflavum DSM 19573 TaxID=1121337 RepID=A0A318XFT5_9FIRM|nr:nitrogenase component 1 [Ruminiclostridium sufflavum]PYG84822.1 nitrogenase molybdenum-iron protein beta chain [Ruminiclostridium sufflavum DSM 19573]